MEIDISFRGPYSFDKDQNSIFKCEYADCAGIYLWAVKQTASNHYLVHYVGETVSLARRHREHLINILGLNYGIFDVGELKNGKIKFLWKGLWRLKNADDPRQMIEEYGSKIKETLEYVESIEIFFAQLDTSNEQRKHIEGSIGWNLRINHPEFKSIFPDDNHIQVKSVNENNTLRIKCDSEIRGIDSVIEI